MSIYRKDYRRIFITGNTSHSIRDMIRRLDLELDLGRDYVYVSYSTMQLNNIAFRKGSLLWLAYGWRDKIAPCVLDYAKAVGMAIVEWEG